MEKPILLNEIHSLIFNNKDLNNEFDKLEQEKPRKVIK